LLTSTHDDEAAERIERFWAWRLADEDHPVALRRTGPGGQGWESDVRFAGPSRTR